MVFRMKDKFNLVDTKIIEFELSNSRGETKNIRDLQGQSVVLVLFRSKN
jgi:peroxiredoxin